MSAAPLCLSAGRYPPHRIWTGKYPAIVAALRTLPAGQAYLDGELCGLRPDGMTSFALIQNAADRRGGAALVYFVFDLLYLDGRNLMPLPLADRKNGLAAVLERREDAICFSEHQVGQGPEFHRHACKLGLEGIVSKRLDAPYSPGEPRPLGQDQMPQPGGVRAHSGERDQPYRLKVITDSGDCDHVDHERLKPGVMVARLHAADISVGCMGMVGPVKSAADRPRSPWRGPRAPRSALASDGAARAGRRCGPPWAIGARAVMQRGFRQRQDVGARMVP